MTMKLTLGKKLGLGFGSVLALMLLSAIFTYVKAAAMKETQDRALSVRAPTLAACKGLERDMNQTQNKGRQTALAGTDPERWQTAKASFDVAWGQIAQDLEKLDSLSPRWTVQENRDRLAEVKRQLVDLRQVQEQVMKEATGPGANEVVNAGNEFTDTVTPINEGAKKSLDAMAESFTKLLQDATEELDAQTSSLSLTLLITTVAAVVIGAFVAIVLSRSVAGATQAALVQAEAIAAGDLTGADLIVRSQDELGDLTIALNKMKNNVSQIIQSIAATAEHVASASEELSSSASLQAQGAETQSNQTTQAATAMQEMSSTVMQVSENSGKAAEASRQAADTARQGGAIVEDTLSKMRVIATSVEGTAKKMEELGKSSDQIGRIAGVIDDIADQTNLLALNAAIEAARAGEQGRGFAVVADEVRKLAERTTTATKEIAQMIKNIQDETKTAVTAMEAGTKQVQDGVASTTLAGDSLKQIIHMSEQVGEMITHIATAATEQSSASEEINNNMEQIAKLVKESTDGAQQSAKACQDLSGLALDLQNMVGNFKLPDTGQINHRRGASKLLSPSARNPRRQDAAFAASAH